MIPGKKPRKKGKRKNIDNFIEAELEAIQRSRKAKPLVKASESKPKPQPKPALKEMLKIDEAAAKKSQVSQDDYQEEIYEEDFENISDEEPAISLNEIKEQLAKENAAALIREKELDEMHEEKPPVHVVNTVVPEIDIKSLKHQEKRNADLLEFIMREKESFNLFELLPLSDQDLYKQKQAKGQIQHRKVDTADSLVDKDQQTEEIETSEAGVQWPGEMGKQSESSVEGVSVKKFVRRVLPVLETLLEDNLSVKSTNVKLTGKEAPEMEFVTSQVTLPNYTSKFQQRFPMASFDVKYLLFLPKKKNLLVSVHELNNDGCLLLLWDVQYPRRPSRVLYTESSVTSVCVSEVSEHVLVAGTALGSLLVWDMRESSTFHEQLRVEKEKFTLRRPSYSTESVSEGHSASIEKLVPIASGEQHFSVVSSSAGEIISWSLVELPSGDIAGSEVDLGLRVGSRLKLVRSASTSLSQLYSLFIPEGSAFAVDPYDGINIVYGCNNKLLHASRFGVKASPKKYESQGTPCTIDFCGNSHMIVGFQCGTIAIYDKHVQVPLSVWLHACLPLVRILWEPNQRPGFFCADSDQNVLVWDLKKNTAQATASVKLDALKWKAFDWVPPNTTKDNMIVAVAESDIVVYSLSLPRVGQGRLEKCLQGLPSNHLAPLAQI